jgi:Fic family protein
MLDKIKYLPLPVDFALPVVFKKVTDASRKLAELKGLSQTIPNQQLLISTLGLQEAKDSSEIENIITTHDELYKGDLQIDQINPATKEVQNYYQALQKGHKLLLEKGLLTNSIILEIQKELEGNDAGFRTTPGTDLVNDRTGEVIYTPPQDPGEIHQLMGNLEAYINNDSLQEIDPLIKMAIIHHQFENIHPFYDGNGRTGRIINVLYLVKQGLLDIPVLYLSRYIVRKKDLYYRYLQEARDSGTWINWVCFILDAVENTAGETIRLIKQIDQAMHSYKRSMKEKAPKIYSKELLENLFFHPYTKIEFVIKDLPLKSRITAAKYLDNLAQIGLVQKAKVGKYNYYINTALMKILQGRSLG